MAININIPQIDPSTVEAIAKQKKMTPEQKEDFQKKVTEFNKQIQRLQNSLKTDGSQEAAAAQQEMKTLVESLQTYLPGVQYLFKFNLQIAVQTSGGVIDSNFLQTHGLTPDYTQEGVLTFDASRQGKLKQTLEGLGYTVTEESGNLTVGVPGMEQALRLVPRLNPRDGDKVQISAPLTSLHGNRIPPGIYTIKIIKGQIALQPLDGSAAYAIDARVVLPHTRSNPEKRTTEEMDALLQRSTERDPSQKNIRPLDKEANEKFLGYKQSKDRYEKHWGNLNPQNSRLQMYGDTGDQLHALWILEEEICKHAPIPKGSTLETYLKSAEGTPERALLQKVEHTLISLFGEARAFVPHAVGQNTIQKGFVVQGNADFGMEVGGVFGVRISEQRLESLFNILKHGTDAELREYLTYLKAEFVHEMVHRLRDEMVSLVHSANMEIASHAVQFLYLRGENARFNEELAEALHHATKPRNHYDTARSLVLAIVQKKLQKHIEQHRMGSVPANCNPETLRQSIASIPKNQQAAILKKIAEEIIRTPATELTALAE